MNKNLIITLTAVSCVIAAIILTKKSEDKDEFSAWKKKFPGDWDVREDAYRKLIFFSNLDKINKHNADKTHTYKMGISQFTAYTDFEFTLTYLSPKVYDPQWQNAVVVMPKFSENIDWTTKGVVSPVKDQGNCGSCWAFSAVATLESFSLMARKQAVSLSQQQLVDCSKKYGNQGCNGGLNYQGLAYVKDHGIALSSAYPYAAKTQSCAFNGGAFKISGVSTAKGCPDILTALASRPLGVSVDATNWSYYASGIFNNCRNFLNHDVFLVGASDSFWIIKNSWGTSWGESGFIRLAAGNTCGICQTNSPWPV